MMEGDLMDAKPVDSLYVECTVMDPRVKQFVEMEPILEGIKDAEVRQDYTMVEEGHGVGRGDLLSV